MNAAQLLKLWRGRATAAALPLEEQWTWKALRKVDVELAQRLREQRDLFDEMCVVGAPKDIAEHGAAMVRGYGVAIACMHRHAVRVERIRVAKQGPNLQQLVEQHGGYDKIPEPAWEQFEREKIVWRGKLINGEFDREDDPSQQEQELR